MTKRAEDLLPISCGFGLFSVTLPSKSSDCWDACGVAVFDVSLIPAVGLLFV